MVGAFRDSPGRTGPRGSSGFPGSMLHITASIGREILTCLNDGLITQVNLRELVEGNFWKSLNRNHIYILYI